MPVPIALAILLIPTGQTPASWSEILLGVALTAIGEGLRFWGVHHIGVISRTRSDRLGPLIDTGPFAYVRNPLYVGNILLWVGFAVTAGMPWLAAVTFVLLAAEYHFIVRWEEALLIERRGKEYVDYCDRVPRWLPGRNLVTTRSQPGSNQVGDNWRATIFSERGTLIAIAAGYLLLWLKARS